MKLPDGAPERAALLIAPEAPYPMRGGGPTRTACLIHYLARRYALDVVVFVEAGAPDPGPEIPAGLVRRVGVIPLPAHSRARLPRLWRNAVRFVRGAPPLVDRFSGFGEDVSRFIGARRYDVAVVEHFWCAPYAAELAAASDRLVLDLHNVESAYYASLAHSGGWPLASAWKRFESASLALEQRWLGRYHLLLATSEEDAARLKGIAPSVQTAVVPNALPRIDQPRVAAVPSIAFSGNLEYPPNVDAVRHFYAQVWPRLKSAHPGLKWRLIGKNPRGVARMLNSDPSIEIDGPVEDAIAELARAQVAVAPIMAGSGTRVKILEAWAAGVPVVATQLGAEGLTAIAGEHLLLSDTPDDFAGAVLRLLDDEELRRRIGESGRRLYLDRFTWEAAWRCLAKAGL